MTSGQSNKLRPVPPVPNPDGFWSKVDQSGGPHACWPWMGAKFHFGHGAYKVAGRPWGSHRVAWALTNGAPDAYVLHICDNPPCCNPSHLYVGTLKDNAQDAVRRARRGRPKKAA